MLEVGKQTQPGDGHEAPFCYLDGSNICSWAWGWLEMVVNGGEGLLESKADLGAKKPGGIRAAMTHCWVWAAASSVSPSVARP